jgi:hypothetical protein
MRSNRESKYGLRCKISPGMFPGELAIETKITGGKTVSLFASKDVVNEIEKLLLVNVIDRTKDNFLVYLPAAPIEVASRTISVPRDEVVELK